MEQQANAVADANEEPAPDSHVGVSRSVARVLGRAARWAVDEAETFGGSAKQVLAAGGRVTTWVTGTGREEERDTHALLVQLKELIAAKPNEELETLEHDPEFWTLLGRLQKSQRRWPWGRSKATAEEASDAVEGALLPADNGDEKQESTGETVEKSEEASAAGGAAAASDEAASDEAAPSPDAAAAKAGEDGAEGATDDSASSEGSSKGKKGK